MNPIDVQIVEMHRRNIDYMNELHENHVKSCIKRDGPRGILEWRDYDTFRLYKEVVDELKRQGNIKDTYLSGCLIKSLHCFLVILSLHLTSPELSDKVVQLLFLGIMISFGFLVYEFGKRFETVSLIREFQSTTGEIFWTNWTEPPSNDEEMEYMRGRIRELNNKKNHEILIYLALSFLFFLANFLVSVYICILRFCLDLPQVDVIFHLIFFLMFLLCYFFLFKCSAMKNRRWVNNIPKLMEKDESVAA